jgi:aminoglycoside phosphotransferase (APT) family kinase protein
MPKAEVEISVELVRALLEEQHPDLAALDLRFENEGWDSAIFRLGDDLAVRLPRRQINAALLPEEMRWLPTLAPKLPLPVNAPVRKGEPGCGYPWHWSVSRWFDGATWADADVRDPFEAATILGMFVGVLGHDAPDDAPVTPYRGGPLTDRDLALRERVEILGDSIDRDAVLALWDEALAAAPNARRVWVHGDLHPANIVVYSGVLSAELARHASA